MTKAILNIGVLLLAALIAFGAAAQAAPPVNDACEAALTIPNGGFSSADNTAAVTEPDDPEGSCWFGGNVGSIFFEFTAAADTARIRTTGSNGRDADFAIYSVDSNAACDKTLWVEQGCSQDDHATFDRNTDVCIGGLTSGETYTLMLVSFNTGSLGDYTVEVDSPCEGADSDGDGVPDAEDFCSADPLKVEAGLCGCGVADTDTDADGTPDCLDFCFEDSSKTAPGLCGCGVLDTDTDADGTPDCLDLCSEDSSKTAPGQCGCGVADTDTDGDGTAYCKDFCDADPLKTSAGVCGCGVADTDTDGDSTLDCNDACWTDPLKTSPGVCGCGVADTDTDDDGTLDCLDPDPDHFLSYDLKKPSEEPEVQKFDVTLEDQFQTDSFTVGNRVSLLNPVDKNDEGISNPNTHLVGYKVKQVRQKGEPTPPKDPIMGIEIKDQFFPNGLIVGIDDVNKADRLLVPASMDLDQLPSPPDGASHNVDHYLCYKVHLPKGISFPEDIQVTLADQFIDPDGEGVIQWFDLGKPRRLCNPVDKEGEGIKNPENHLICYDVKRSEGEPEHEKTVVFLNDQFGPANFWETQEEERLCVPAERTLP